MLVDRIYEETEGNPFFLSEIVELARARRARSTPIRSPDISQCPDGVREALGRRLDRLSEDANELLQLAAIVGREFAYETLSLLEEREPDALLELLEEGLHARVVEETERAGRYRFTHGLMQETLLAELSMTRQVRLHGRVGEVLEQRWGDRAPEYAARLALHFAESATLTREHATKAVHYLALGAREAEAGFAWAEAARLYGRATTLIVDSSDGRFEEDEAERLTALGRCAIADAQMRNGYGAINRALDLYRTRGAGPVSRALHSSSARQWASVQPRASRPSGRKRWRSSAAGTSRLRRPSRSCWTPRICTHTSIPSLRTAAGSGRARSWSSTALAQALPPCCNGTAHAHCKTGTSAPQLACFGARSRRPVFAPTPRGSLC